MEEKITEGKEEKTTEGKEEKMEEKITANENVIVGLKAFYFGLLFLSAFVAYVSIGDFAHNNLANSDFVHIDFPLVAAHCFVFLSTTIIFHVVIRMLEKENEVHRCSEVNNQKEEM